MVINRIGNGANLNPRTVGGGAEIRPPHDTFANGEKTAARSAAGFLHSCWYINSAHFVKIFTSGHLRSGHQTRAQFYQKKIDVEK